MNIRPDSGHLMIVAHELRCRKKYAPLTLEKPARAVWSSDGMPEPTPVHHNYDVGPEQGIEVTSKPDTPNGQAERDARQA